MLDEAVAPFDGAFTAINEQDFRTAGRTRIIEAAMTGMAENGRGEEAKALLQHDDFAGDLDETTSARLTNNIELLSEAHDRDRLEREQREAADETSARARAVIAFTTDLRPRMATGEATHAEIASAETEGTLTTAQAESLRAEMADELDRRENALARSDRVNGALQAGNRLDPEDFDDHDDVAHHYEATLKPSLADLDPVQKAAAIRGYVADTGIAPIAALNSLLGLAATGEAEGRIAAAHALTELFDKDPTSRDKVPQPLADFAELIGLLTGSDAIPPDDIIKVGDGLIRGISPGAKQDQPDPGLFLLASAGDSADVLTDGQPDAEPDTAEESDSAPTDATEDSEVTEADEDDIEAQRDRPDGRLKPGLDETVESATKREENINRDRDPDGLADPDRPRRSGRFSDTLKDAEISAEARNEAIDQKKGSDARDAEIARKNARDRRERLEKIKWKPGGRQTPSGSWEIKVKGPVLVEASSIAFGLDQKYIDVDWQPLDKDGKVLPGIPRNKYRKETGIGVGTLSPEVVQKKGRLPLEPPFDWPHGFKVTVSFPPQNPAHGNTKGLQLQLSGPEGGLIK